MTTMKNTVKMSGPEGTCGDVHDILEAEWSDEPDPRTGFAYLVILSTEPSACCYAPKPMLFGACESVEEASIPF
jgi:hypothetical protein